MKILILLVVCSALALLSSTASADRVYGGYPAPQDWVGSWMMQYDVVYSSCPGVAVATQRKALLEVGYDAKTTHYNLTEVPLGNNWGKVRGAANYSMSMWRKTVPVTLSFRYNGKKSSAGLDLSAAPDSTMRGMRVVTKTLSRKNVCATVYSVSGKRSE